MALRRASPPEGVPPRSRSEESSEFAPGLQRRCGAGEETAGNAYHEGKKQQPRIDISVQASCSRVLGQECDERPYGNRRDHYAEQSTSKCEKHAVGKKLPSNSPA